MFWKVAKGVEGVELTKDKDEVRAANGVELRPTDEDLEELHTKRNDGVAEELKPAKDAVFLNLSKDFKEMTAKLSLVESKLKVVSFSSHPRNSVACELIICHLAMLGVPPMWNASHTNRK